jgi:hypothetical protein
MNKKYNIEQFIDDPDLVIQCYDLYELRKVGKYLWNCSTFKIEEFNPTTGPDFPYIVWCSKTGTNFNPLRHKDINQTIIQFEDVDFNDFILPEKWCIKMEHQEYYDWNNKLFKTSIDNTHAKQGYYGYYEGLTYVGGTTQPKNNYTEITFDQFKKYVLKNTIIDYDNYVYLINFLSKLNIK